MAYINVSHGNRAQTPGKDEDGNRFREVVITSLVSRHGVYFFFYVNVFIYLVSDTTCVVNKYLLCRNRM